MKLKPYNLKINYDFLLTIITLLGLFLRLYRLSYHDLWYGEACSVIQARDINYFTQRVSVTSQPTLYYIILSHWMNLWGKSELSIRLLSAVTGILSIPLIYIIGTYFYNKKVGLFSAFILAITPLHIWYSQEARMYSVSIFAILLMALFFFRLIKNRSVLNWIIFVTSSIVNLCLSYLSFLVLIAMLIFLLPKKYSCEKRPFFYILLVIAASYMVIVLASKYSSIIKVASWIPLRNTQDIMTIIASLFLGYTAYHLNYKVIIAVYLLIIFIWLKENKYAKKEFLLFNCSITPLLTLILLSPSPSASIFLTRYIMPFSPFLYILTSNALFKVKKKTIPIALGLVLIALMAFSLFNYFNDYMPNEMAHLWGCFIKKPFKPVVNIIRRQLREGDIIAHSNPCTLTPFLYYLRDLNVKQIFLTIPSEQDRYWKNILALNQKSTGDNFSYTVKELGRDKKYYDNQRLWLISSSWRRDGILDHHSKSVLSLAYFRFKNILKFYNNGMLVNLFSMEKTEKAISTDKQQVVSADTEDIQKIQKIIKAIIMALASNDMDSIMQHISPNYLVPLDDESIDYTEFKASTEKNLNHFFKHHLASFVTNIEISNLKIKNNNAFVDVKNTYEAFNLDIAKWVRGTNERQFAFSKENGVWKITQWYWIKESVILRIKSEPF